VNYICWDGNGEALASVSLNMVKIWSLNSGECIQEITSTGSQFHSCVFHPSYSTLLVIGGYSVSFCSLPVATCNKHMDSKTILLDLNASDHGKTSHYTGFGLMDNKNIIRLHQKPEIQ